jgi:hypothetical protein
LQPVTISRVLEQGGFYASQDGHLLRAAPASAIRRAHRLRGQHNDAVATPLPDKEPIVISARKLCLLSVPVIAAISLTAGTGVAVADDDAYLAQLKKIGVSWPSGDDYKLISLGHAICADRTAGKTPDALAGDVQSALSGGGFSYSDATAIVSAAESNYCP